MTKHQASALVLRFLAEMVEADGASDGIRGPPR